MSQATTKIPKSAKVKFDHYCGQIYIEMKKLEEDPEFKKLLSQTLQEFEKGENKELMRLQYHYTRRCTIEQFRSCRRLGIYFDMIDRETDIIREKFFEQAMEMLKSNWFIKYENEWEAKGCWIIDMSSLPEFAKEEKKYQILIKSDWVATYPAKDIALGLRKLGYLWRNFKYKTLVEQPNGEPIRTTSTDSDAVNNDVFGNYDKAIAVIDNRQSFAQNVVKSALKLLGFTNANKEYIHLSYGVVFLTPNTLEKMWFELSDDERSQKKLPFASRKWRTVTIDDMMDMLHAKAYETTKNKHTDRSDEKVHEVAEKIAVWALRFALLRMDIDKDITFDIDEALSFDGETWPYIQYTLARINGIVRKYDIQDTKKAILWDFCAESLSANGIDIESARPLLIKMSEFKDCVSKAVNEYKPNYIAKYLFELCQDFNHYYQATKIIDPEDQIWTEVRIFFLNKIQKLMEQANKLIWIPVIDEM